MPTALSPRLRLGYASGGVATGAFGTVPGLLLLPYLTDTLGVSPVVAGVIVFAPKAWDVVLNPVTGRLSDRYSSRHGTRAPFLLWGGAGLALGFALLFAGPQSPSGLAAGWVVATFLLCATAYSAFQVPYVALPAELTDDYTERTRLLTWRVAVLTLAILASGATAPLIRNAVGGAAGYRAMAVFVAVLILVGALTAYVSTRHLRPGAAPAPTGGLWVQLRVAAQVQDFRRLLLTFGVQALAIGAMLAGVDYVARHVLRSPGSAAVLFGCFVGPALLVTPGWQWLAARVGKLRGYQLSSLLLGAGAAGLVSAGRTPPVVTFVLTGLTGVGYAGCQLFPLAMLPDVAGQDARRTGQNRVGVFTGIWTAGETFGLALGPAVFAVVLALGGYLPSVGAAAEQPDRAVLAITLGFSVLPAALILLSLIALRGYALTKEDVDGRR